MGHGTHIDLRDDNQHCLALWWFASTCRHLGIGGAHSDPLVATAQKLAMQRYHRLERFYKRGGFYGINEEIHIHVLPDEEALVVNIFNLSNESRLISGRIAAEQMGLPVDRWYVTAQGVGFDSKTGMLVVNRQLDP